MNIANRRSTAERHWRAARSVLSDEALMPVQPRLVQPRSATIDALRAWSVFERAGGRSASQSSSRRLRKIFCIRRDPKMIHYALVREDRFHFGLQRGGIEWLDDVIVHTGLLCGDHVLGLRFRRDHDK